jgi:hypothetical protein
MDLYPEEVIDATALWLLWQHPLLHLGHVWYHSGSSSGGRGVLIHVLYHFGGRGVLIHAWSGGLPADWSYMQEEKLKIPASFSFSWSLIGPTLQEDGSRMVGAMRGWVWVQHLTTCGLRHRRRNTPRRCWHRRGATAHPMVADAHQHWRRAEAEPRLLIKGRHTI